MAADGYPNDLSDRRSEPRQIMGRFYSVELTAQGLLARYQFKLHDISKNGLCIIIKKDSAVLSHLNVGDTLKMKYYSIEQSGLPELLTTQIRHITKQTQGRYREHYLVGLQVMDMP